MNDVLNISENDIQILTIYITLLKSRNPQWSSPKLANEVVHLTNEEPLQWRGKDAAIEIRRAVTEILNKRFNKLNIKSIKLADEKLIEDVRNITISNETNNNSLITDSKQDNLPNLPSSIENNRPLKAENINTFSCNDSSTGHKISGEKTSQTGIDIEHLKNTNANYFVNDYFPDIPFSIEKNEKYGRHLVSTRDIKAGELVLIEGPVGRGPIVKKPIQNTESCCIECGRAANDRICFACGFHLCKATRCQKQHPESEECKYLKTFELFKDQEHIRSMEQRNFKDMIKDLHPEDREKCISSISSAYTSLLEEQKLKIFQYYPFLATFKLLCRIRRSRVLRLCVQSLQSNVVVSSKRYKINKKCIVDPIKKTNLPFSDDYIHKTASYWDVNAFQCKAGTTNCQTLYITASLFTHSCKPNCEHSFSSDGFILIRAVDDIRANDVLTLSYTESAWPTYIRKDHLLHTKGFLCDCERCTDPTECGTLMGHIRCENCGQVAVKVPPVQDLSVFISCSKCNNQFYMNGFFKREAAMCNLLSKPDHQPTTLLQYQQNLSEIEEQFHSLYHENHHIIQRMRVDFLLSHANMDIKGIDEESLRSMAKIAKTAYNCTGHLPKMSQLKARLAREWMRFEAEICKRSARDIEEDEEMKLLIGETQKVLHWHPSLHQFKL